MIDNQADANYSSQVKPAVKSKTLWFSGLVTALGIAAEAIPVIKDTIAEKPGWAGIALVATGLINAYLRSKTTKAIVK